jgi:hypothetical protein
LGCDVRFICIVFFSREVELTMARRKEMGRKRGKREGADFPPYLDIRFITFPNENYRIYLHEKETRIWSI